MPETVSEWLSKRSGFVGGFAYAAASSADDMYELPGIGRDEKMRRLGVETPPVDDWLKLYRDHRRVQRGMNEALMPLILGYPDAGDDYNRLQDGLRSLRGITAEEVITDDYRVPAGTDPPTHRPPHLSSAG